MFRLNRQIYDDNNDDDDDDDDDYHDKDEDEDVDSDDYNDGNDDDAHDDYEDGCKEMPGEPIRDLQSVLTHPTNIGAMATRSFCKREKLERNRKYV